MTNALQGQPAELRATITIKRAATGKTETYDLIGRVPALPADQPATTETTHHDNDTLDSGA